MCESSVLDSRGPPTTFEGVSLSQLASRAKAGIVATAASCAPLAPCWCFCLTGWQPFHFTRVCSSIKKLMVPTNKEIQQQRKAF